MVFGPLVGGAGRVIEGRMSATRAPAVWRALAGDLGTIEGHIAAYTALQDTQELTLSFERDGQLLRATYMLVSEDIR